MTFGVGIFPLYLHCCFQMKVTGIRNILSYCSIYRNIAETCWYSQKPPIKLSDYHIHIIYFQFWTAALQHSNVFNCKQQRLKYVSFGACKYKGYVGLVIHGDTRIKIVKENFFSLYNFSTKQNIPKNSILTCRGWTHFDVCKFLQLNWLFLILTNVRLVDNFV